MDDQILFRTPDFTVLREFQTIQHDLHENCHRGLGLKIEWPDNFVCFFFYVSSINTRSKLDVPIFRPAKIDVLLIANTKD